MRDGTIVKAAICVRARNNPDLDEDRIFTGYRHAMIRTEIIAELGNVFLDMDWDFGFVTDSGEFLRRKPAKAMVVLNGQLKNPTPGLLQSDHLWDEEGNPL